MSYQFLNCLRLLQGICPFYLILLLQPPALEIAHPRATSTLLLQTTTPTVLLLCQQALCSCEHLHVLCTQLPTRDLHWHMGDSEGRSVLCWSRRVFPLLLWATLLGRSQISHASSPHAMDGNPQLIPGMLSEQDLLLGKSTKHIAFLH